MPYVNFNIDSSFPFGLISSFLMFAVTKLYVFIRAITPVHLKTGILNNIKRKFAFVEALVDRSLAKVPSSTQNQAKESNELAKKLLFRYRKLFVLVERANFFNDASFQVMCERTLDKIYDFESGTREIAYCDHPLDPQDKELYEFSTNVGYKSI